MPQRAAQDRSIAPIALTNNGHTTPAEVRAHLLALIERLPDEAMVRLWRFVCWWLTPREH